MGSPTRLLTVDPDTPDPAAIEEAAAVLRRGGLVAFPTETVYGLGADATNPEAVARIFAAKGRPATNPLIVHGADIGFVRRAVLEWPMAAAKLAHRFWPGPLTLVLPRSEAIPDVVTARQETVGVRVPDCAVAEKLLKTFGGLVAAPSANRSTGVSPSTASHVLKDLEGKVDLVLDGGPTHVGIESTVLDLTRDPPRLLRPGAITARQIGNALGIEVVTPTTPVTAAPGEVQASPGLLDVHYAPRARLLVIDPSRVLTEPGVSPWPSGLIVAGPHSVPFVSGVYDERVDWRDPEIAARELYATLHRWDDRKIHRIDVVLPPQDDDWRAVHDRLWRASRRWARGGLRDDG
jgi:L-threonylcarbamoyladenylate synthase